MKIDQEVVDLVKEIFPTLTVTTEDDGRGDQRVLAGFLSLERCLVECPSLLGVRNNPGWLAILDNGEDCVELYEGLFLERALIAMAECHAKWRVQSIWDKHNPCLVPSGYHNSQP